MATELESGTFLTSPASAQARRWAAPEHQPVDPYFFFMPIIHSSYLACIALFLINRSRSLVSFARYQLYSSS